MAKVIVADENEGRRSLLANTLEREGFEITRAGTLRQAEGTALAIMPEVVLVDSEWKNGDAIDASQRLMGDPEFAFKCRIVILSRNTSQEYLVSAAQAGVAEVMGKPIDMSALVEQLHRHTKKQFVPPPAEVNTGGGSGGTFDVSMTMGDSTWALPMLKGLVGPEKIDSSFIDEILGQMGEEGLEVNDELDPSTMSAMLRLALNKLVGELIGLVADRVEDQRVEQLHPARLRAHQHALANRAAHLPVAVQVFFVPPRHVEGRHLLLVVLGLLDLAERPSLAAQSRERVDP